MSIDALNALNNRANNTANSGDAAKQLNDRFLRLLVAQMNNQDPLNPLDNAQMTSQIAQINTVSGIEKLNRTVESLLSSFSSLQAQSANQLPGRAVLIEGAGMTLGENGAAAGVELAGKADSVVVEILDSNGAKVSSFDLGKSEAGVKSFGWDGTRDDGTQAAEGEYRIRVTAKKGTDTVKATALSLATVQAVSSTGSAVRLDLGAKGTAAYGDVKAFL
jgi:flagellar basal-body rod modification protein FlgD